MKPKQILRLGAVAMGGAAIVALTADRLKYCKPLQSYLLRRHTKIVPNFDPSVLLKRCKNSGERYRLFCTLMRLHQTHFFMVAKAVELGWPVGPRCVISSCYTCNRGGTQIAFQIMGYQVWLHDNLQELQLAGIVGEIPVEFNGTNPRYEDFCREVVKMEPSEIERMRDNPA